VTLSDLSIERPVLTWMLMLGLIVFGLLGYLRLGVDQYPDMEFPEVAVVARLDGATPEVMEQDVTDVLEEYLSTVSGVRTLRSTSYAGISNIGVEFELGVDLDTAIQDVRDQVAAARNRLPIDVEPPAVSRIRIGSYPVVYVPFMLDEARASLRSLVELSEYVRYEVKPLLENIPGVAGVSLSGRRDRNVRIWLDGDALRARGLAASDVIAALRREHVEVPGGLVEGPRLEWTVKTEAEFTSVERMQELVVAQQGDAAILLRDVARVEDGEADLRALTRCAGVSTPCGRSSPKASRSWTRSSSSTSRCRSASRWPRPSSPWPSEACWRCSSSSSSCAG
jgi:HAE1 family hydrophobic/amphiphilic exporter-1